MSGTRAMPPTIIARPMIGGLFVLAAGGKRRTAAAVAAAAARCAKRRPGGGYAACCTAALRVIPVLLPVSSPYVEVNDGLCGQEWDSSRRQERGKDNGTVERKADAPSVCHKSAGRY